MKIRIAGHGEYDMPDNFTYREMNFIKKMTGLRAGELYPALNAGDSDVYAAFALTAIRRADATVTEDDIMDMQIDEIELVVEDADGKGADGDPPAVGGDLPSKDEETPPEKPSVSTNSTTGDLATIS